MNKKFAIIGCGNISKFHVEAYQKSEAAIIAVADTNKELADKTAALCGCKAYYDYNEMLQNKEIDAVSICLPNFLHFEASLAAIKAGKAVLVEKPMTLTSSDAKILMEAVETYKATLYVGYMKRTHPAMQKFKELVPKIGEIETGIIRAFHPFPNWLWGEKGLGNSWFLKKSTGGGGMLTHGGSHVLDLFEWSCSKIKAVNATIKFHEVQTEADYITNGIIELENGNTVLLETGWLPLSGIGFREDGWDEMIEIRGKKGKLNLFTTTWDRPETSVPKVELYLEETGEKKTFISGSHNYFLLQVEEFVKCVNSGEKSKILANVKDGYRTELLLEALYKSSEEKTRVIIEE